MWYGNVGQRVSIVRWKQLCLTTCKTSLERTYDTSRTDTEEPREGIDRSNLEETTPSVTLIHDLIADATYIEPNKDPHKPEVTPVMRVEDVETRLQELIRGLERAVFAGTRRVRVGKVPAGGADERVEVLRASLTGRRGKFYELDRRAINLRATNGYTIAKSQTLS